MGVLHSVPTASLIIMYHEMKLEVEQVLPEGRETAAKRNGLAKVEAALRAKDFGWMVDGEATETLRSGDIARAIEGEATGTAEPSTGGIEGVGKDVSANQLGAEA